MKKCVDIRSVYKYL